jgi:hypothetical protein
MSIYDSIETEGTDRVLMLTAASVKRDPYAFKDNTHRADVKFKIAGISNDDQKPRWVNLTSQKRQLYIQNLTINFWESSEFGTAGKLLGGDASFYDVYKVELCEAEAMTKTLKTIQSKLRTAELLRGHPQTTADLIARLCSVFGIKSVYIPTGNTGNLAYDSYRIMPIAEFTKWWTVSEQLLLASMHDKTALTLDELVEPLFETK